VNLGVWNCHIAFKSRLTAKSALAWKPPCSSALGRQQRQSAHVSGPADCQRAQPSLNDAPSPVQLERRAGRARCTLVVARHTRTDMLHTLLCVQFLCMGRHSRAANCAPAWRPGAALLHAKRTKTWQHLSQCCCQQNTDAPMQGEDQNPAVPMQGEDQDLHLSGPSPRRLWTKTKTGQQHPALLMAREGMTGFSSACREDSAAHLTGKITPNIQPATACTSASKQYLPRHTNGMRPHGATEMRCRAATEMRRHAASERGTRLPLHQPMGWG